MAEQGDNVANGPSGGDFVPRGIQAANVAGTGNDANSKRPTLFDSKHCEKAIDKKAASHLSKMYNVNGKQLETLSIVYCYLAMWDKLEVGSNEPDIVNWSGSSDGWKRRQRRRIGELVALGCLELIPYGPTKNRLCITQKGLHVLDSFDRRFKEIKASIESKAIINKLARETSKLKHSARAKAQRKTGRYFGPLPGGAQ